jgi:hypothetical protein
MMLPPVDELGDTPPDGIAESVEASYIGGKMSGTSAEEALSPEPEEEASAPEEAETEESEEAAIEEEEAEAEGEEEGKDPVEASLTLGGNDEVSVLPAVVVPAVAVVAVMELAIVAVVAVLEVIDVLLAAVEEELYVLLAAVEEERNVLLEAVEEDEERPVLDVDDNVARGGPVKKNGDCASYGLRYSFLLQQVEGKWPGIVTCGVGNGPSEATVDEILISAQLA